MIGNKERFGIILEILDEIQELYFEIGIKLEKVKYHLKLMKTSPKSRVSVLKKIKEANEEDRVSETDNFDIDKLVREGR